MAGLEFQLPEGYELASKDPESMALDALDSGKWHVILRYAVKPIKDPHAELKQQYALDVETCASIDGLEPWQLWQWQYFLSANKSEWFNLDKNMKIFHSEYFNRRHPHADSIIAYHKCSPEDKKRWQSSYLNDGRWSDCKREPAWHDDCEYRLKPRTISVTLQNGDVIEFPEPVREPLNNGDDYFVLFTGRSNWSNNKHDLYRLKEGMMFKTESDRQDAHDAIQAILSQRSE